MYLLLDSIEEMFEKYKNRVISDTYEIRCCSGLSIKLLERLSTDLHFDVELYLTGDSKYGSKDNGTWNGLVGDLMRNRAHMAVGAMSVTKERSEVIEFTHPYFFSGFSILVAEKKRSVPLYAFMEPFDGVVWSSLFVSASVAAISVSILEWNSPFGLNPWGRKRKTNYTLGIYPLFKKFSFFPY